MIFSRKKRSNLPAVGFSDEKELIAMAIDGSEAACEEIFRRNKDRLFSLCYRMSGDFHSAEDILQESFLKAFHSLRQFRQDSSLATWLYRVTVNSAVGHLRQKRQVAGLFTQTSHGDGSEQMESGEGGANVQDQSWKMLDLERAIAVLPEGYRMVLVLHDVEGWEHHEIADLLGCSVGTSKSQLFKARSRIRELLGEYARRTGANESTSPH